MTGGADHCRMRATQSGTGAHKSGQPMAGTEAFSAIGPLPFFDRLPHVPSRGIRVGCDLEIGYTFGAEKLGPFEGWK
ncbi:hypothetical protein FBZ93_113132 [Bradyrhizobium macuxiense]|uniref:Uncharacterized protein n=1 Tax=Bradyrhizobium macuxiense TaxID=1755647 RepID=A0A560L9Z1_9BRAD|nr:hypothetical protein FBZ93_113132 [Bradyrhizobium macuxiense]